MERLVKILRWFSNISNTAEQHCDNKDMTEEMKLQDSPCSSTNYEPNEEARTSVTDEKQKGDSMVRYIYVFKFMLS
jgi:hypothetical protein